MHHAIAFAELAGVGCLIPFHYDPDHEDQALDALYAVAGRGRNVVVAPAREGTELVI